MGRWKDGQFDRQTDEQMSPTDRQTEKNPYIQTGRQVCRQAAGTQAARQTGRRADRQTCRQAERQKGRQADIQTGRQACRQAGYRQTERQVRRQRDNYKAFITKVTYCYP